MTEQNKIEVPTELEQHKKMVIMCMSLASDLFGGMMEKMLFEKKKALNYKYRELPEDNRKRRKQKEKVKGFEYKQYVKIMNSYTEKMTVLAESFAIQDSKLEDELALIGYEVMDQIFPIKK